MKLEGRELATCVALYLLSPRVVRQQYNKGVHQTHIISKAVRVASETFEMMVVLSSILTLNVKELREKVHYGRMLTFTTFATVIGSLRIILQTKSSTSTKSEPKKDFEPTELKILAKVIVSIAAITFAFQGMYIAAAIGTISVIIPFAKELKVIPAFAQNFLYKVTKHKNHITNSLLLLAIARVCMAQKK